ncbi:unnamed protein product [Periconia digitata]|uniref:F-box domain-containing protein n=1 Tax=Periconia digitata TaxID=1303443 RepID=A0A9W4XN89_9PLEO|nr:unnamed protein product [Periconia digitata]
MVSTILSNTLHANMSATTCPVAKEAASQPYDPKDPEGYLRRCSGHNKKKGTRCSAIIGRNSQQAKDSHSTYLPTCHTHKDQKKYAGRCKFTQPGGEKCRVLFEWTPPQFELCADHQGQSDTPCYLMSLPLELRLEIFRYLLPKRAIGSSTSLLHVAEEEEEPPGWFCLYTPNASNSHSISRPGMIRKSGQVSPIERSTLASVFPAPLLNVLVLNRQIYTEMKDLLYSTVPFTVDVRKDGTFMCGRRLLEPRRADGSSHFVANEVDNMKNKFLQTFEWANVKNYNVDILVEKWEDTQVMSRAPGFWDEEVEIYDIRDYVGVVVSGILAKSDNLCKLNVRIGLSKFTWSEEELMKNIKTIVGPFERLRNVRQPRLRGIYDSTPHTNFMISLPLPAQARAARAGPELQAKLPTPLCSVPQLPAQAPLQACIQSSFTDYRSEWEGRISLTAPSSIISKPPIRNMFTQFKEFYAQLCYIIPAVTHKTGRLAFLHRARVAREQEDVEAFRLLQAELINYWYTYQENERQIKAKLEQKLCKLLDVDVYPLNIPDTDNNIPKSTSQSPLMPNMEPPPPSIASSQLGAIQQARKNSYSQLSSSSDPSPSPPAIQQTMALNPHPPPRQHILSLNHDGEMELRSRQQLMQHLQMQQQQAQQMQQRQLGYQYIHQQMMLAQAQSQQNEPRLSHLSPVTAPRQATTPTHISAPNSILHQMKQKPDSAVKRENQYISPSTTPSSSAQQSPTATCFQQQQQQQQNLFPSTTNSSPNSGPGYWKACDDRNTRGSSYTMGYKEWLEFVHVDDGASSASSSSSSSSPPSQTKSLKRGLPSPTEEEFFPHAATANFPDPKQKRQCRPGQEREDYGLGLGLGLGTTVVKMENADAETDMESHVRVKVEVDEHQQQQPVEFERGRKTWVDDGRREVNDCGDEILVLTEEHDVFRLWEGADGKGKGRA